MNAVLLLLSKSGAKTLAEKPEARDFVSDAFAHNKFIGYTDEAMPLIEAVGLDSKMDDGFIDVEKNSAKDFIKTLRDIRYWAR